MIFFSNYILANEADNNEVEVINLYENKSLDQLVLENLNDKKQIEEEQYNLDEANEIENKDIEIEENQTTKIEVNQIEIDEDNFIYKQNINDLKNYLNNFQKLFKNFTKGISSSFRKSTIKY